MIRLTDREGIGHVFWRIRRAAGMSPEGLAARLGLSRSGVCRREGTGHFPASALVEHARALGYEVALIPARKPVPGRHPGVRTTGTGWPA